MPYKNKEKAKEYSREYYLKNREKIYKRRVLRINKGLCERCGAPADMYRLCKAHRKEETDRLARRTEERKKSGRCVACGRPLWDVGCVVCQERIANWRIRKNW